MFAKYTQILTKVGLMFILFNSQAPPSLAGSQLIRFFQTISHITKVATLYVLCTYLLLGPESILRGYLFKYRSALLIYHMRQFTGCVQGFYMISNVGLFQTIAPGRSPSLGGFLGAPLLLIILLHSRALKLALPLPNK